MSDTEQPPQEPLQSQLPPGSNSDSESASAPKVVSAAAKAAEEGKRVYVGNIPFKTTYSELRELFEGFDVVNVTIPKAKTATKNGGGFFFRKLGYAFVELLTKEEAERAAKEYDGKMLQDREIAVKMAKAIEKKPKSATVQPQSATAPGSVNNNRKGSGGPRRRPNGPATTDSVHVSNMAPDTKKEDLEELFAGMTIAEMKVTSKSARKTRRKGTQVVIPPRAHALVKFADPVHQQKAIDEFDGKTLKDQEISVKVANEMVLEEEKVKPEPEPPAADSTTTTDSVANDTVTTDTVANENTE